MILLLACIGLTFLVKASAICEDAIPIRPMLRSLGAWGEKLQHCAFCVGIWCSAAFLAACFLERAPAIAGGGALIACALGPIFKLGRVRDLFAWAAIGSIVALSIGGLYFDAMTTATHALAGAACAYAFDVVTLHYESRSA